MYTNNQLISNFHFLNTDNTHQNDYSNENTINMFNMTKSHKKNYILSVINWFYIHYISCWERFLIFRMLISIKFCIFWQLLRGDSSLRQVAAPPLWKFQLLSLKFHFHRGSPLFFSNWIIKRNMKKYNYKNKSKFQNFEPALTTRAFFCLF